MLYFVEMYDRKNEDGRKLELKVPESVVARKLELKVPGNEVSGREKADTLELLEEDLKEWLGELKAEEELTKVCLHTNCVP